MKCMFSSVQFRSSDRSDLSACLLCLLKALTSFAINSKSRVPRSHLKKPKNLRRRLPRSHLKKKKRRNQTSTKKQRRLQTSKKNQTRWQHCKWRRKVKV